jgi:hypothetical protein
MFFSDILEEFFARVRGDGSPKKLWTAILSIIIGLLFLGNLTYWFIHASEVFSFLFIQKSVDMLFPWFIVTWVVVMFSANGYIKIRNKLFDIETAVVESPRTKKARAKSDDEAKEIMAESVSEPKKVASAVETIPGSDADEDLAELAELADLE